MRCSASATRFARHLLAAHGGDDGAEGLVLLRSAARHDEQVDAGVQRLDRGLADAAAGRGGRRDEVGGDDRALEADPVAQLLDGVGQQRRGRDAVVRGVDRVGHLDRRDRAIAARDRLERLHVGVAQLVEAQAHRGGPERRVLRGAAVAGERVHGRDDLRLAVRGHGRLDRADHARRLVGERATLRRAARNRDVRRSARGSCSRRARAAAGRRPARCRARPCARCRRRPASAGARLPKALNSPPSCCAATIGAGCPASRAAVCSACVSAESCCGWV